MTEEKSAHTPEIEAKALSATGKKDARRSLNPEPREPPSPRSKPPHPRNKQLQDTQAAAPKQPEPDVLSIHDADDIAPHTATVDIPPPPPPTATADIAINNGASAIDTAGNGQADEAPQNDDSQGESSDEGVTDSDGSDI